MFVYAIEIKNKKDITTQLPKTNIQKVKNRSYINKKEKDEKETGGKSNQNSSLKSNGSGDNLEKKDIALILTLLCYDLSENKMVSFLNKLTNEKKLIKKYTHCINIKIHFII